MSSQDDIMMVDEVGHLGEGLAAAAIVAPSAPPTVSESSASLAALNLAAGPAADPVPVGFTSTLAFRPTSSARAAESAVTASATDNLDNLPAATSLIPGRAYRAHLDKIAEDAPGVDALAYASTQAGNAEHRHVFTAAGLLKVQSEARWAKLEISEAVDEITDYQGYVERLRHHQKKKNMRFERLSQVIAQHGSVELKAALEDAEAKVKEEHAKMDEEWLRKKQGTNWPDLDDDVL